MLLSWTSSLLNVVSFQEMADHAHIRYKEETGDIVEDILGDKVTDFNVMAEGLLVCTTTDVLTAFHCLLATHYTFNLVYLKKVEASYIFIQKILMNIKDSSPTPKKVIKLLYEVNRQLSE